jgi:hypothetical protein
LPFSPVPRFLFETVMALLISISCISGRFAHGVRGASLRCPSRSTMSSSMRGCGFQRWRASPWRDHTGHSFARSEEKPFLPSVLIAYAFLFAGQRHGGFGLGSGLPDIWPKVCYVFAAHFALASVLGLITLSSSCGCVHLQRGIIFSGSCSPLFAIDPAFRLMDQAPVRNGSGDSIHPDQSNIRASFPNPQPV